MTAALLFIRTFWQPIAGVLLAVALIAFYNHHVNGLISEAADKATKTERGIWQVQMATAEREATAAADKKAADHRLTVDKVNEDAKKQIAISDARVMSERNASDRLRQQLAAIRDNPAEQSCTVPGTLTTSATTRALADIAGQCSERYRELVAAAREGYNAGRTCEAQYAGIAEVK